MDREDIRLGIRNIKNLPTLPIIVSRVLEVADDSGSSANELAVVEAGPLVRSSYHAANQVP